MTKHLELFAKYAGLVTVCIEWLAVILFYILRPAEFSGQHAISYFAALPETRIIFSIFLTIAAISFWIFTRYHLNKYYVVPVRLFTTSMIGYAAVALVPYDPYNVTSDIVHKGFGFFFLLSFLLGVYLMGKHNKAVKRVSYWAVGLSSFAALLFVLTPKDSELLLLFESLSVFVGQVWIVWISFHSASVKS